MKYCINDIDVTLKANLVEIEIEADSEEEVRGLIWEIKSYNPYLADGRSQKARELYDKISDAAAETFDVEGIDFLGDIEAGEGREPDSPGQRFLFGDADGA